MKIKDGFVLTQVGDSFVAVPVGERAQAFHGIVRLNDSGAFIWRGLNEGLSEEQIAERMLAEYADVEPPQAKSAVRALVEKLRNEGFLEE